MREADVRRAADVAVTGIIDHALDCGGFKRAFLSVSNFEGQDELFDAWTKIVQAAIEGMPDPDPDPKTDPEPDPEPDTATDAEPEPVPEPPPEMVLTPEPLPVGTPNQTAIGAVAEISELEVEAMADYARILLEGPERAGECGYPYDKVSEPVVCKLSRSVLTLARVFLGEAKVGPIFGRADTNRARRVIQILAGRKWVSDREIAQEMEIRISLVAAYVRHADKDLRKRHHRIVRRKDKDGDMFYQIERIDQKPGAPGARSPRLTKKKGRPGRGRRKSVEAESDGSKAGQVGEGDPGGGGPPV